MIYLDNAATSYPKPPEVIEALNDCLNRCGANPGRGAYRMALNSGRVIYETRQSLAKLFRVADSADIVFTASATEALNLAIKGMVKPGDHIVTTMVEHNSVLRPLSWLKEHRGVDFTKVGCSPEGELDLEELKRSFRKETALIVVNHASNVIGGILWIEAISEIAKEKGVPLLLDAAQTAGLIPIDVAKMGIDLLAFAGHKGLLGPQGTGGLYISPEIDLMELVQGGTGTESGGPQPKARPERYECGTPNTPGIAGLGAAVELILDKTPEAIFKKEKALIDKLMIGLSRIPSLIIYGPKPGKERVPLVALNLKGVSCHAVAHTLDKVFDIASRAGLHCAPDAHKIMGTEKTGALRLSLGYYNTDKDIDDTLAAMEKTAGNLLRKQA